MTFPLDVIKTDTHYYIGSARIEKEVLENEYYNSDRIKELMNTKMVFLINRHDKSVNINRYNRVNNVLYINPNNVIGTISKIDLDNCTIELDDNSIRDKYIGRIDKSQKVKIAGIVNSRYSSNPSKFNHVSFSLRIEENENNE